MYPQSSTRRLGVEREFLLHDGAGNPVRKANALRNRLAARGDVDLARIPLEHDGSQVETTTQPQSNLDDLIEELRFLEGACREEAHRMGLEITAVPHGPFRRPQMGMFQADHIHVECHGLADEIRVTQTIAAFAPELLAYAMCPARMLGREAPVLGWRLGAHNANLGPPPPSLEVAWLEANKLPWRTTVKSRHYDVTPFTSLNADGSRKPTVEVRFPDAHPSLERMARLAWIIRALADRSDAWYLGEPIETAANRSRVLETRLDAVMELTPLHRRIGLSEPTTARNVLDRLFQALGAPFDAVPIDPELEFPFEPTWLQRRAAQEARTLDCSSWETVWILDPTQIVVESPAGEPRADLAWARRMDQLASRGDLLGDAATDFTALRDLLMEQAEHWHAGAPEDLARMLIHAHRAGLHGKALGPVFERLQPHATLPIVAEALGRYQQDLERVPSPTGTWNDVHLVQGGWLDPAALRALRPTTFDEEVVLHDLLGSGSNADSGSPLA